MTEVTTLVVLVWLTRCLQLYMTLRKLEDALPFRKMLRVMVPAAKAGRLEPSIRAVAPAVAINFLIM